MKWKKKKLQSDLSGLFSFSMCQSTEVRVWALDPALLSCKHALGTFFSLPGLGLNISRTGAMTVPIA